MFGATLQGVGMAYFQVTERMQFTAIISVLQGVTLRRPITRDVFPMVTYDGCFAMYGVSSLVTGVIAFIMTIRYTKIRVGIKAF